MFDVLAGLALEFITECSPTAKKILNKTCEMVGAQEKTINDKYERQLQRVSTMSDERLLEYARINKERLKSSVEGAAVVKELKDRGLTGN